MSLYSDMAVAVTNMLSGPNPMASTRARVSRAAEAIPAPDADFSDLPSPAAPTTYDFDAVVIGVEERFLTAENSTIVHTDVEVICGTKVQDNQSENGAIIDFEFTASDKILLDDEEHTIVQIERVPAVGTAVAFFIIVRK